MGDLYEAHEKFSGWGVRRRDAMGFDKAEAECAVAALNAAHARGELDPQPAPTLYTRADGKCVADERWEDKGRFYAHKFCIRERGTRHVFAEMYAIEGICGLEVTKVAESRVGEFSAAFDRRNRKPVEQRSGKDRRETFISGRRAYDDFEPDFGEQNQGRRSRGTDRRVTTGTAADRKGGE